MPRFSGIASMFRLPVQTDASGLDVAIIGVPLDIGTSNRNGTRYGPRQIRSESVLVRPYGMATGAAPFDSFQIADTGDVALNPYNLLKSIDLIESHYSASLIHDIVPVSIGGDHTITLPILRAIAGPDSTLSGEPVALVIGSANRDERVFPNPDRFDIDRDFGDSLSFGRGIHFCLGASLARMEGRICCDEILSRFSDYEIDEAKLVRAHSGNVRGFSSMPMRLTAAA